MSAITFHKVTLDHKETIFDWLQKPHVIQFWDNSQEHRDDIIDFMQGRTSPTPYFNGIFDYWIGCVNGEPHAFLLTSEVLAGQPDLKEEWRPHLSVTGKTFTIDFMIGNEKFLGKGLAAPTLEAFTQFMHNTIDKCIDTFIIDPDINNPKAAHVYGKAGFVTIGQFVVQHGFFEGHTSLLMVKMLNKKSC